MTQTQSDTPSVPPPPRRPVSVRSPTSHRHNNTKPNSPPHHPTTSTSSPSSLPRAGTFRHRRPASANLSTTTGSSLRRGATSIHRPNATAEKERPTDESTITDSQPSNTGGTRLRRGATMLPKNSSSNRLTSEEKSPELVPRVRRGSVRVSSVADNMLPRAGTFAYGTETTTETHTPITAPPQITSQVRRASSTDKLGRQQRVCGMCSSCGGGGIRSMPPWAPERMKTLTPQQRMLVEMDLQQKEERGRLEAELRKKRLADAQAMTARLEKRRSRQIPELVVDTEEDSDPGSKNEKSEYAHVEAEKSEILDGDNVDVAPRIDVEDLDMVDLSGAEVEKKANRNNTDEAQNGITKQDLHHTPLMNERDKEKGKNIEPVKQNNSNPDVSSDEDSLVVPGIVELNDEGDKENDWKKSTIEDCNQCDDLEGKVKDLEEQLDVLREVVKMCAEQDEKERESRESSNEGGVQLQREKRKGKTWMGKIASAYYGSSTAANERNKLKDEVDALRKATDLLFKKMQPSV